MRGQVITMRLTTLSTLAAALALTVTTPAWAQDGDAGAAPSAPDAAPSPAPPTEAAPPATPAPALTATVHADADAGVAVPSLPVEPTAPAEDDKSYPRLAPRFGEERYPGDGLPGGIDVGLGPAAKDDGYRFSFHGYFRAPFRMSWVKRPAGSTTPTEGNYNYRTPFLVDDDYFRSGFAYSHISESDWAELFMSVGNKNLTATIGFQASQFSGWSRPLVDRQLGVTHAFVRYRYEPVVRPFKLRVLVKAGAFWDRFGWLPKYDTYIFGRLHQMGEQLRVEVEKNGLTVWALHGLGVHQEAIDANQGLTLANYAHVGANYKGVVEGGVYIIETTARDKRQLKELTDADLTVKGLDARVNLPMVGRIYGATSWVDATQSTYTSPVLELMHSYGGRVLTENYFGTQKSENGTGALWNTYFQYDFSLANLFRGLREDKISPIPWGGDVTLTAFGLFTRVESKQKDPNPLLNRDGRGLFKWGTEGMYRVNDWFGASFRYDRIVMDVDDSANSFRILSPRLTFFTNFAGGEAIYVQYSRYLYNERIRLRPGQVQLETIPDDNVVKVQAQMTF